MTTVSYNLTYTVISESRLDAIMQAGRLLRTGVRVTELVSAERSSPMVWEVELRVAEDLGEPAEPVWDLPESMDDITQAKAAESWTAA